MNKFLQGGGKTHLMKLTQPSVGWMFAAFIVLLLMPCLYMVIDDCGRLKRKWIASHE